MEQELVSGLESFFFSRTLITEKLVERFKGNGGNPAVEFASFIAAETGLNAAFVTEEVRRLIKLRCIEERSAGVTSNFTWL
jgi:hypothetical protein